MRMCKENTSLVVSHTTVVSPTISITTTASESWFHTPNQMTFLDSREAGGRATLVEPPGAEVLRWEKVLYKKQPFADNHVDGTFLEHLVTNANVVERSYWVMVRNTANVTQEILVVMIFCIVFKFTHDVVGAPPTAIVEKGGVIVAHTDDTQRCDSNGQHEIQDQWLTVLIILDAATLILGYALQLVLWPSHFTLHNVGQAIKNLTLFVVILLVISPVLRTLTKSFSDDTIYALTIWLFGVHLVFYDYTFVEIFWFYGTLSLNAAIFASVLLASRLTSDSHSFAIVTFAIALFGVFPIFRHAVHLYSPLFHLGLTGLMFLVVWKMLASIAPFLVILFVATMGMITFAAPGLFIRLQTLKREITGPWDIAKVEPQVQDEDERFSAATNSSSRRLQVNQRSLSMTTLSQLASNED